MTITRYLRLPQNLAISRQAAVHVTFVWVNMIVVREKARLLGEGAAGSIQIEANCTM